MKMAKQVLVAIALAALLMLVLWQLAGLHQ
jgi:hypothetical protein